MMHSTLYWGTTVTLLFDPWTTNSYTSYFLALLLCSLTAASFHFIEAQRLKLNRSVHSALVESRKGVRLVLAALVGVESAIGYVLMLCMMSFNGGVLVAVVVGGAVGYLLFRGRDWEPVSWISRDLMIS
ncbi:hypothetical protein Droror1_Dr00001413 [Drosera rotundifolia]